MLGITLSICIVAVVLVLWLNTITSQLERIAEALEPRDKAAIPRQMERNDDE
jgi:hypothetical protein